MGDVLLLCYHLVDPHCRDEMSVPPDRLRRQVAALLERGYRPRTWSGALAAAPSERVLAVTFDDAFAGTYAHAAPVLADLGVVGTVFVPTALVTAGVPMTWPGLERHALTDQERTPTTWRQLEELAGQGWEIGSHSRTHARLDACPDDALDEELQGSARECEQRLQRPCTSLAYPFGSAGARVRAAAGRAGYASAALLGCATGRGPGQEAGREVDPALSVPRLGVYQGDGAWRLRLKVTRAARTPAFCSALAAARSVRARLPVR